MILPTKRIIKGEANCLLFKPLAESLNSISIGLHPVDPVEIQISRCHHFSLRKKWLERITFVIFCFLILVFGLQIKVRLQFCKRASRRNRSSPQTLFFNSDSTSLWTSMRLIASFFSNLRLGLPSSKYTLIKRPLLYTLRGTICNFFCFILVVIEMISFLCKSSFLDCVEL